MSSRETKQLGHLLVCINRSVQPWLHEQTAATAYRQGPWFDDPTSGLFVKPAILVATVAKDLITRSHLAVEQHVSLDNPGSPCLTLTTERRNGRGDRKE